MVKLAMTISLVSILHFVVNDVFFAFILQIKTLEMSSI